MAIVLVADDHDGVRHLVCTLLKSRYEVREARDGAEALAILAEQVVDVAVLDLDMPHYTGLEVCQYIRNDDRLCGIGVVILTGSTVYPAVGQGSVDKVLHKPSGVRLVTTVVERLRSSPGRTAGTPT